MARKTFSDILNDISFDVVSEYDTLHRIVYEPRSFYSSSCLIAFAENDFLGLPFRGSCISLHSFNERFGFDFEERHYCSDFDYFLAFCEYAYNLAYALESIEPFESRYFLLILDHIRKVLSDVNYGPHRLDDLFIFVDEQPEIVEAAAVAPEGIGPRLYEYHHHSLDGDIDSKRKILVELASRLEPKRDDLKSASSKLESSLFFAFNNINIRHNNIAEGTKGYRAVISTMSDSELEQWYDRTYRMCLEAFLALERSGFSEDIDNLKNDR